MEDFHIIYHIKARLSQVKLCVQTSTSCELHQGFYQCFITIFGPSHSSDINLRRFPVSFPLRTLYFYCFWLFCYIVIILTAKSTLHVTAKLDITLMVIRYRVRWINVNIVWGKRNACDEHLPARIRLLTNSVIFTTTWTDCYMKRKLKWLQKPEFC